MEVREVTFEDILPYWENHLWPNRKSPIEPASSMLYLGGYDVSIKTLYKPRFFAVFDDRIVGVNSGHQTAPTHFRSRGIWVGPMTLNNGYGRALIAAVEQAARDAKCELLWSAPRQSALPFYEKCGFTQTSDFFDHGMEFGPNCYVMKQL